MSYTPPCDWEAVAPDMDGVTRHLASCVQHATVVVVADDGYAAMCSGELSERFACDAHKAEMSTSDDFWDVLEVRILDGIVR